MPEITPFNFEGQGVRWKWIDGVPWFVAADVCSALKIVNPSQAVDRLDGDDLCQTEVIDSMGRKQWAWAISEPGMYELIFRSDKPEAKKFRRWVTSTVLPALREHGSYSVIPVEPDDEMDVLDNALQRIRETRRRVRALESGQRTLEAKVSAIEGEYDEFTTLGFAKLRGLPTDRVSCQRHGQRASRLMRARLQEPRKRQDATFGTVNVYPLPVLEETAE